MRYSNCFGVNSKLKMVQELALDVYARRTLGVNDFDTQLHFSFSDDENEQYDVYTDLDENNDFVMIFGIGFLEEVYSYSYTAFARKDVISYLGDAEKECNIAIEAHFTNGDIVLSGVPFDQERKKAAEKVVEYMLLFIIEHEMAHLINGHNTYLKNTYGTGMTKLKEDTSAFLESYCVDRKTLEYDADMSSATSIYTRIMEDGRLFDIDITEQEFEDFIFVMAGFAIYSVFALLSKNTSESNKLYMTLEERLLLIIGNINELVDYELCNYRLKNGIGLGTKGYVYAVLKNDITIGCNEAAIFSKNIVGLKMRTYKEMFDGNPYMKEHLDAVNTEWKRMIADPELKEAAIGNIYDPQKEAEWRKEVGLPESVHDYLKETLNLYENDMEGFIKKYYPELTKKQEKIRKTTKRFNVGLSENSEYMYVMKLAKKMFREKTNTWKVYGLPLHFFFSFEENEINDICTYFDEDGEPVMVMGTNLVQGIYDYVDVISSHILGEKQHNTQNGNFKEMLYYYIFSFILLHEMSHIVSGHNVYLNDTYGRGKMKMLSDDYFISEIYGKDRIAFDFDSDMLAIEQMYFDLLEYYIELTKHIKENNLDRFVFMQGGLAIFGIFDIFRNQASYDNCTYLTLEDRVRNVFFYFNIIHDNACNEGVIIQDCNSNELRGLIEKMEQGYNYAAEIVKSDVRLEQNSVDSMLRISEIYMYLQILYDKMAFK